MSDRNVSLLPFAPTTDAAPHGPPQPRERAAQRSNPPPPSSESVGDACEAAFRRELPDLLRTAPDRWVGYTSAGRAFMADSQTAVYRHMLDTLGLSHDAFVVRQIAPDPGPEVEYTAR